MKYDSGGVRKPKSRFGLSLRRGFGDFSPFITKIFHVDLNIRNSTSTSVRQLQVDAPRQKIAEPRLL
jgi:hypothetical protein